MLKRASVLSYQKLHPITWEDVDAQKASFAFALRCCADAKALIDGHHVHCCIMQSELWQDNFLANLLLQMYGKCCAVSDASCLFSQMPSRDRFGWNFMIRAYDQDGFILESIAAFSHMLRESFLPDKHIFTSILSACANGKDLFHGVQMHVHIVACGTEADPAVGGNLVNMYGKCGRLEDSSHVFRGLHERTPMSWTVLIAAYAEYGNDRDVIELFEEMRQDGVPLDKITFLSIVSACASRAALAEGRQVHKVACQSGYGSEILVANSLIDMYGKCGSINDAFEVFGGLQAADLVSWTAIIAAFSRCEKPLHAFKHFLQMHQEGFLPNRVTFINILSACTSQELLREGKKLHTAILNQRFDKDISVGTSLLNMYKNCGSSRDALVVYKNSSVKDEAANISILSLCASCGFLMDGRDVHMYITMSGTDIEKNISIALLNFYGKCGCIEDAERIFHLMDKEDAIVWNVMVATYAQNGQGMEALKILHKMWEQKVTPDKATYSTILTACSHTGLMNEAISWFMFIIDQELESKPVAEQYNCMVDLLARVGMLDEACKFADSMPLKPSGITWLTVLSICRSQAYVRLAESSARHVMELAPEEPGTYVMLANMYCHEGYEE